MSKKWTRRSALALMGSGAGLLTWGTGGFTDVSADRSVNIDTTADDSDTGEPLLGITTHDDQLVFETETPPIVTLTNNTGSKLDTIGATVQNSAQLDAEIDSVPNSLDNGESGTVTATITGSGSNKAKTDGTINLEIAASSSSTGSAPKITASRSVSLSCVNCINFQDSTIDTPSGFIPDLGKEFGPRDSDSDWTIGYGWTKNQESEARNYPTDGVSAEDQTHNHFVVITDNHPTRFSNSENPVNEDWSPPDPSWEIGLPNGWYDVTMHCQDTIYSDQEYSFDIDGGAETVKVRDRKFDNDDKERSEEAETYSFPVEVKASNLTITPPNGTYNPKISWLQFESRGGPNQPTVDISAKGVSNKRGISQNQDYYFKITNNYDASIDLTAVRVDFARTVDGDTYRQPDLFGRANGNYEVEVSVGEALSFTYYGTSYNADYRDELRNKWYDDIGEKAALGGTSGGDRLAGNEEAELGLFGFREKTSNGNATTTGNTDPVDMEGADVHITLWYEKDGDDTEYSTTSAVFSSET